MKRNERLSASGWQSVNDDQDESEIYDAFTRVRGFSSPPVTVVFPAGHISFNFTRMPFRPCDPFVELRLRVALLKTFCICSSGKNCFLIDVNHTCFTFVPDSLVLDSIFEPWPCEVTPISDFVSFNDHDFSNGTFANPKTRTLHVYGKALIDEISKALPIPWERDRTMRSTKDI